MDSVIIKPPRDRRIVATATAAGGTTVRIPINKDSATSEIHINTQVSQSYSTTAPSSVTLGKFFSTVAVDLGGGNIITMDGPEAYQIGSFTENAAAAAGAFSSSFGVAGGAAATVNFNMDVHLEMDAGLHDLWSAILGSGKNQFDLILTTAADNNNGFGGGVGPGAASYTFTVETSNYPAFNSPDFVRNGTIERFWPYAVRFLHPSTSGTTLADMALNVGARNRFIMVSTYSVSGGIATPSDAVLSAISLKIGSRRPRDMTIASFRHDNVANRSFNTVGYYIFDFGDATSEFLDLTTEKTASLGFTATASPPASYLIKVHQFYYDTPKK